MSSVVLVLVACFAQHIFGERIARPCSDTCSSSVAFFCFCSCPGRLHKLCKLCSLCKYVYTHAMIYNWFNMIIAMHSKEIKGNPPFLSLPPHSLLCACWQRCRFKCIDFCVALQKERAAWITHAQTTAPTPAAIILLLHLLPFTPLPLLPPLLLLHLLTHQSLLSTFTSPVLLEVSLTAHRAPFRLLNGSDLLCTTTLTISLPFFATHLSPLSTEF